MKDVLIADGYPWNDKLVLLSAITKACKLEFDTIKTRLPIGKKLLNLIPFEIQGKFAELKQPFLELLYVTAFIMAYYGLMRVGEISNGPHVLKAKDLHKKTQNKL